jgi:hypothetical protein
MGIDVNAVAQLISGKAPGYILPLNQELCS